MICPKDIAPVPAEKLTPREIEVLSWTARGKTRAEISAMLSISEETIKNYLEKSCRKLCAANKTQAVVIALTLGLISPYRNDSPESLLPQTGDCS